MWALAACVGIVASGCDKLPLLAPQLSTISLTSNSTIVQANGTAEIRATVLESAGTPVQNGTTVSFTTTLGTVNPPDARTVNGVATTQFVGNGQSGEAEIRAASGGAKPADTANPSLKLKVGGAAAGRLAVSATPSRLPAAGGSSTITATVSDTSGNPLASVPVTFSTTNGTLSNPVATYWFQRTGIGHFEHDQGCDRDRCGRRERDRCDHPGDCQRCGGSRANAGLRDNVAADPTVGQTVTFTLNVGAGSATADPFRSIVINFGDGSSQDLGGVSGTVTVAHVYDASDTYTVTATGTTASGDSQTATTVIFVAPQDSNRRRDLGTEYCRLQDVSGTYSVSLTPANTRVQSITVGLSVTASQCKQRLAQRPPMCITTRDRTR